MNVRLRHTFVFAAGVYYGGEMRMNHYTATICMTTNSHDAVSHNVAFERIKFFVYTCLDSSIFINQDQTDMCEKYSQAGLSVTTLPGEPVDQLIGLMLYYKLNAIMADRIVVDKTEISSVLGENMIYLHSDNESTDIPSVPAWWNLEDPVHSDYITVGANKVVSMRSAMPWRDLDLEWPEEPATVETGNIVVFADFKNNETK
jgi:hypothetical protein